MTLLSQLKTKGMKNKIFIVLCLLLFMVRVNAQRDSVIYYLNDTFGTSTNKSATIEMIGHKINDTLWQCYLYERASNWLMFKGLYKDSSLTVLNGKYESLDKEGNIVLEGEEFTRNNVKCSYKKIPFNRVEIDTFTYHQDSLLTEIHYKYLDDILFNYSYTIFKKDKKVYEDLVYNHDGNITERTYLLNDTGYKKTFYNNGKLCSSTNYKEKQAFEVYFDSLGIEITKKQYNRWKRRNPHFNAPKFKGDFNKLTFYLQEHSQDRDSITKESLYDYVTIHYELNTKGEAVNIVTDPVCDEKTLSDIKHIFSKYIYWDMRGNKSWWKLRYRKPSRYNFFIRFSPINRIR